MMDTITPSPVGIAARSPAAIRATVLADAKQLESLRPDWTDLLSRCSMIEPMLSPLWLIPWWQIYGEGSGAELQMCQFHQGDRLVGLAPLQKRRHRYPPGLRFLRLEPLGADGDLHDGAGTDYLNVIAERGAEDAVASAMTQALADSLFGDWDELVLPAMDGAGVMPQLLANALAAKGFVVDYAKTGAAPYIALPATWDAYLQSLKGKYRYQARRTLRQFDKWAGGQVQIHRVESAAELAYGRQILVGLHNARWSQSGVGGAFDKRRFRAFHDIVLPSLFEANALDLMWVTARREPIAVDYSIVWNNKVYLYQGGRRMDVPKRIRAGVFLTVAGIRRAIEDGRTEFDFLGGESLYKKQLALQTRPLVQLRAVRPSLNERLRRLAERGLVCVRGVRRRLAGRK